jgi:signal transduction histidine kinase
VRLRRSGGLSGRAPDDRFAILVHELRGPVQVLSLNLDSILDRFSSNARMSSEWLRERLERQRRAIRRIELLFESLVGAYQMGNGNLSLRPEPTDLRDLVGEVLRNEADALAWAGCPCTCDAPSAVTGVWDPLQLRIAVTNLIGNALKHAGGRPVEIAVGRDESKAWVRVRDHGEGIAAEDQQRIFEPFVRVDSRNEVGGFGLGLWLVKNIARAHAGDVELTSTPGHGACFTMTLPIPSPCVSALDDRLVR